MSTEPDAAINQLAQFLTQHPGSSKERIAFALDWPWEKVQMTLAGLRYRRRLVRSGNTFYVKVQPTRTK